MFLSHHSANIVREKCARNCSTLEPPCPQHTVSPRLWSNHKKHGGRVCTPMGGWVGVETYMHHPLWHLGMASLCGPLNPTPPPPPPGIQGRPTNKVPDRTDIGNRTAARCTTGHRQPWLPPSRHCPFSLYGKSPPPPHGPALRSRSPQPVRRPIRKRVACGTWGAIHKQHHRHNA